MAVLLQQMHMIQTRKTGDNGSDDKNKDPFSEEILSAYIHRRYVLPSIDKYEFHMS